METLEQDAYNTIAGLASRLNINEDKATLLLLSFKWDEEKIILAVSEHLVNAALSTYFVNRPHFDNKRVRCLLCKIRKSCQNVGCEHYICNNCLRAYVESRLLRGELQILCPYRTCKKFLSHSFLSNCRRDLFF